MSEAGTTGPNTLTENTEIIETDILDLPEEVKVTIKEAQGGISFEIAIAYAEKQPIRIRKRSGSARKQEEEFDDFPYWGMYGRDEHTLARPCWPVFRAKNYRDLQLTDREKKGVLTHRIIASCSSCIDKNPITKQFILAKCDLSFKVFGFIFI